LTIGNNSGKNLLLKIFQNKEAFPISEYTLITQMVDLPGYQVVKAVVKSETIDL